MYITAVEKLPTSKSVNICSFDIISPLSWQIKFLYKHTVYHFVMETWSNVTSVSFFDCFNVKVQTIHRSKDAQREHAG